MAGRVMALAALVVFGLAPACADTLRPAPRQPQGACAMQAADRQWLDGAMAAWPGVQRQYLKAPPRPWPVLVVYDAACHYVLTARADRAEIARADRYSGGVALPNGARMPPGPNAFFTALPAGEATVLMALPSVWAAAPHPRTVPLGSLLEAILFHELTHAYQAAATPSASFLAFHRRGVPSRLLRDDAIQDIYKSNAGYAALVAREWRLLRTAAAEPDRGKARAWACQAAEAIEDRQRRYLSAETGERLAELDEFSITSEGLGNWVAFRWLTEQRGVAPDAATAVLGGRSWSQEIGLALFQALNRVAPGWERRLLSDPPASGTGLLAESCR